MSEAAGASPHGIPLSSIKVGECCEVVFIRSQSRARRERLGAYGIIPGSRLVLHQKRPAFVIRVGETDLALDEELAREILVRRMKPEH